jgi:hypothetical protein
MVDRLERRRGAQGAAAIAAVAVDLDGVEGWLLAGDLDPTPESGHWVALLPALDPTTMGWKERDWYLGEHRPVLFDSNGNAGPTIWVDGRIVGGWAVRPAGEVVTRLLRDVGRETERTVDAEAAALTAGTHRCIDPAVSNTSTGSSWVDSPRRRSVSARSATRGRGPRSATSRSGARRSRSSTCVGARSPRASSAGSSSGSARRRCSIPPAGPIARRAWATCGWTAGIIERVLADASLLRLPLVRQDNRVTAGRAGRPGRRGSSSVAFLSANPPRSLHRQAWPATAQRRSSTMKLEPRRIPSPWPIQTRPTATNAVATVQRVRIGASRVAS